MITVICSRCSRREGKSAQVPLPVWLPDSMEGPTPISALSTRRRWDGRHLHGGEDHRSSRCRRTLLHFIVVIGATTALFMGLLASSQRQHQRVIAYSTCRARVHDGGARAGAYSAGIFPPDDPRRSSRALLFLAAGSYSSAMHHEQDMRRMGGLRRYMPVTYWTT